MPRPFFMVALLLCAGLAGCSAPEPKEAVFEDERTGCIRVAAAYVQPLDVVQELLPPGFLVRGGDPELGLPVGRDEALLVMEGVSCTGSLVDGEAVADFWVWVGVSPPSVDGVPSAADRHRYLLWPWTTAASERAARAEAGLDDRAVEVEVAEGTSGTARTGSSSAAAGGLRVADFDIISESVVTLPGGTFRYWEEVEDGVAFTDVTVAGRRGHSGSVTFCNVEGGSPMHRASGRVDCKQGPMWGLFVEAADSKRSFQHWPVARLVS